MKNSKFYGIAVLLIVAVLVFTVIGCGNSTVQKENEYKDQWTEIMDKFESQVTSDDAKANAFVEKNDIAGLYDLINKREAYVKTVLRQILELFPPEKYQNVHILTLFYLYSLEGRLKAQNDLNKALLSGHPTTDLTKISDEYIVRTQQIGTELGIEITKAGLNLKTEVPSSTELKE